MAATATIHNEADWIAHIQAVFAAEGALDQAQVAAEAPTLELVSARVNVDAFHAGSHFPWPSANPAACGRRCLLAAASDLAAVGSQPQHLLMSLSMPALDAERIAEGSAFVQGMARAAAGCGCTLIGGDVTRGAFSAHLVVAGPNRFPRAGSQHVQVGDTLWITGTVGDAMAELALFQQGGVALPDAGRFFSPPRRFEVGAALWARPWTIVVTDLSDGWLRDLDSVCRVSGDDLGLALDPRCVPRSSQWRAQTSADQDVLRASYWGGDDYELAFATRGADPDEVKQTAAECGVAVAAIGTVKQGRSISWIVPPEVESPAGLGYDPYL